MNRSVYVLGVALLAIGTSLLRADPVDPVYSMGDPTTGTPVTSSNFVFGSDAMGGGILSFVNDSGILWNSLSISVTEPSNIAITILPGLFFNTNQFSSTAVGNGNSIFTIGLFNTGASSGGIANGQFFTINLNDLIGNVQNTDPNGAGGWGNDAQFGAAANVVADPTGVPEPVSIWLVAAGLGSTWLLTRRRRASL